MAVNPEWIAAVQSWACAQPEIRRVWLYGSRILGTHREDSDLDVGVELFGEEDGQRLADWLLEKEKWTQSLQALVTTTIHLELADPINTPDNVWPAVQEHGLKVFDRAE